MLHSGLFFLDEQLMIYYNRIFLSTSKKQIRTLKLLDGSQHVTVNPRIVPKNDVSITIILAAVSAAKTRRDKSPSTQSMSSLNNKHFMLFHSYVYFMYTKLYTLHFS